MFRNRVTAFPQFLLCAGLCMAVRPGLAQSQDTSPSKAPASPTTPQPTPQVSSAPAAPPSPEPRKAPAAAPAPEKKAKKVWTNDDLKSVKTGVSVVGDANKGTAEDYYVRDEEADSSDNQYLHQQQLAEYRNQILQVHAQLDAVDKRIAQLKDFKGTDSSASGGITLHQRYNMVPLEEQVKQLESRKKELQAEIENLENEARKNGIEPGELR